MEPEREAETTSKADSDELGMSYKDVCGVISAAISEGAPTYNSGDHGGCYDIYKGAAEEIVEHCFVDIVQQVLRSALDIASKQPNVTNRAWTMRHSFDAILLSGEFLSDATESAESDMAKDQGEKASSASKDTTVMGMGYKDACSVISAAINKGAPTYNSGDYRGCYDMYRQTAEKLLEQCFVGSVQRVLHSALDKVALQSSFTDRVWTVRHAFDAILRCDFDTTESAESEKPMGGKVPSAFKDATVMDMSYKDACSVISSTINKGAPMYSSGDHSGCYDIYKETAEKILEHCSVSSVQKELHLALGLVTEQSSFTTRARTMRRAFDAILLGDFDTTESAESDMPKEGKVSPAFRDISMLGMSYKDACCEISAAISKGAPTYNSGDHSGCYDIYKQTAEKIAEHCFVDSVQRVLRLALDRVTEQSSFTNRAWTLRHVFDAIVSGEFDTTDSSESEMPKGGGEDPPASEDASVLRMGYKDACRVILATINKGAPTYNSGDHSGCYDIYKETAENILELCLVDSIQQVLRLALDRTTEQSNVTDRAWTIRHAFDAILDGDFDSA